VTKLKIGALIVLGLIVLIVVPFAFRWLTAEPRGALDARERTKASGAFRIAAYDHFFDLCAAVQADEARIEALKQEYASNPTPQRQTQIEASLTAVRSSRAEKISRYNTDAAKGYTIGQFRSAKLPPRLSTDQEETTCIFEG
jgi:hypothetical protein